MATLTQRREARVLLGEAEGGELTVWAESVECAVIGGKDTHIKFLVLQLSQYGWSREHKAEKQQDRTSEHSSVMLIILNFILRALNALRQERNIIRCNHNVENIFERSKTRIFQQLKKEKTTEA